MAELIEPFERELRRSRKTTPQIQSWFEDDMARALAEMEARTGTARTYGDLQPGDAEAGIIAREAPRQTQAATVDEMIANPVREPENLDAVRRELIDPLVQAYGMDGRSMRPARVSQPRTFEMGNELVQVDPTTGRAASIFTQNKPAPEMTPRQRLEYSDLLKRRQAITSKERLRDTDTATLAELEKQIAGFFEPAATATVPTVPPVPRGDIFMGDPLQRPATAAPAGAAPTITSKQQFDALPSGATYVGKNGKRYRKP